METLITTSTGIVYDKQGNIFLQIITAAEENHYFVPLSRFQASQLIEAEDIRAVKFNRDITPVTDFII